MKSNSNYVITKTVTNPTSQQLEKIYVKGLH